jgi:hypothetical protein
LRVLEESEIVSLLNLGFAKLRALSLDRGSASWQTKPQSQSSIENQIRPITPASPTTNRLWQMVYTVIEYYGIIMPGSKVAGRQ